MPRYRRQQSETGVYHIFIRGIDRMHIFLDDEDKNRFLDTLKRFKKECGFELYAYCLMNNHIHLELRELAIPIKIIMQKIGASYVYYFNKKYDRVGPLFQGRFRSEIIETTEYLLWCMRYIHNNPVVAGLVNNAEDYIWSSYAHYLGREDPRKLIDTGFMLEQFAQSHTEAVQRLRQFTREENEDCFLDINVNQKAVQRIREQRKILMKVLKKYNTSLEELQSTTDIPRRTLVLQELKHLTGASARELSQLLGLSKDMIYRS